MSWAMTWAKFFNTSLLLSGLLKPARHIDCEHEDIYAWGSAYLFYAENKSAKKDYKNRKTNLRQLALGNPWKYIFCTNGCDLTVKLLANSIYVNIYETSVS